MKRIIAAFDGLKYSTSTRDYSIALAKAGNMHLTAVFLDDFSYTSYKVYELITEEGVSEKKLRQFAR
ncbi:MAG TPA: universal stress protein, partial [Ferruginibacter sp.]|nr:universal stress protein [Ferruginibacter sp.]